MLPLALYGDGNCQFRAVSLEQYGMQEHRTKESMEIAMHQEWYDEWNEWAVFNVPSNTVGSMTITVNISVVLPDYVELCKQASTSGSDVSTMCVCVCAPALSVVCGWTFHDWMIPSVIILSSSHCPVDQGGLPRPHHTMWTASLMSIDATVNAVNINHFVPLLRRAVTSTVVWVVISQWMWTFCKQSLIIAWWWRGVCHWPCC